MRGRIARCLVVLALVLAGAEGIGAIRGSLIRQFDATRLTEMSQRLLNRAELAIDYAVITLTDVDFANLASCSASDKRRLEALVMQHGSVKDLQVRGASGQILCSAFGSGDTAASPAPTGKPEPARNARISLASIGARFSGLLQVSWRKVDNSTLVAVLNLDTLMFDVFPPALRDDAWAAIAITGDSIVAGYAPSVSARLDGPTAVFVAASQRYPLAATLTVKSAALDRWNDETRVLAQLFGGLLGALAGLLAYRQLGQRPDPVAEFRRAVLSGQITPYFQPIFSLADRSIVGCEVLARWIRPDGSVISPDRFIPMAETSGLVVPMTEHLVRESLSQIKLLLTQEASFELAFNVNQEHFLSNGFLDTLSRLVREAGVLRRHIVIELTERQSFGDSAQAARVSQEAREMGFRIALDDTGSGHNGLAQVQELAIDVIKIDKKFVDRVCEDVAAASIVKMLVNLARDLGKTTLAEGIETESQRVRLMEWGVELGQGYLVAPALRAEAFLELVRRDGQSKIAQAQAASFSLRDRAAARTCRGAQPPDLQIPQP